jgi:cephalosporin hydroxylase
MDLYTYFLNNAGRNILKNPHYFPIYERHLSPFRNRAVTVLEIGTGAGGSCQMWKYYFGPYARIVTIDTRDERQFEEAQIYPRTGSQADPEFLQKIIDEFGPPDIVLDDGSHMMGDISATFEFVYPRMHSNGVYLVEDLDGAYWRERGGGLRAPGSFIERCKHLVDEMNAEFTEGALQRSEYGRDLVSVSFYPMIVVLEKSPYLNRIMVQKPVPL